jgi:hypothetical protein
MYIIKRIILKQKFIYIHSSSDCMIEKLNKNLVCMPFTPYSHTHSTIKNENRNLTSPIAHSANLYTVSLSFIFQQQKLSSKMLLIIEKSKHLKLIIIINLFFLF